MGHPSPSETESFPSLRAFTGVWFLLVCLLGLLFTSLSSRLEQARIRRELLGDASLFLNALSSTQLHQLAAADPGILVLTEQQIRDWLDYQGGAIRLRFVTRGAGADSFRLLLDAGPTRMEAPPGDVSELLPRLTEAFQTRHPVFSTPENEEGILCLVYPLPLRSPEDGTAFLVLSRPVEPLPFSWLSWALILLLPAGLLLLLWLAGTPPPPRQSPRGVFWYLLTIFFLMVGFTAMVTWRVHRFESGVLQNRFEMEAQSLFQGFSSHLTSLRDLEFPVWRGFFAASDVVDEAEFALFADKLIWESPASAWMWMEWAPGEDGINPPRILQTHPPGAGDPPADPADLRTALGSSAVMASRPAPAQDGVSVISFVYCPTVPKNASQDVSGFVVARIDWREVLHRFAFPRMREEPRLHVRLEMLGPGADGTTLLAETPFPLAESNLVHQQKLFLFGRVLLLTVRPASAYFEGSPYLLSRAVGFFGCIFSFLLILLFRQHLLSASFLAGELQKRAADMEAAFGQYRILSEALPVGVALIDSGRNLRHANPKLTQWFPDPAALPDPSAEIFPQVREVRTPDGLRVLRFQCTPCHIGGDAPEGRLLLAEDVTDSMALEKREQRHQNFMRLVTEISGELVKARDEVWENTLQTTLRRLGEFFSADRCCILRLDRDPLRMSNTFEWCAPGVSSQIAELQDVPAEALPWWFEQMQHGRVIRLSSLETLPEDALLDREELARQEVRSLLYFTMLDEKGASIGALGFDSTRGEQFWDAEDVSMLEILTDVITTLLHRREDRRRLRASEESYRHLVDNSTSGVISLELLSDAEGNPSDFRFLSVNPAFSALFGVAGETLPGRLASAALPVLLHPSCFTAFADVALRKHPVSRDISLTSPLPLDFSMTAYSMGGLRIAAMLQDISGQKQSERKNQELASQLQQSQKMESIGRLAGGVAHDFNNALQIVLGNADLALNFHEPKPVVRQALEEIRQAARKSASLTQQLLAFARKQKIEPKVVNLNEVVETSLKMLRRLLGEDVELQWRPCEQLDPVYMDPGQLDQILINLCVNARDALGAVGRITLSTSRYVLEEESVRYPECTPGPHARLTVADNGHGIPPEVMDRIFEPFFTTKGQGQGTGLGLATVMGIVMQNHGFVSVESEPGAGTAFHINIPFSLVEAEDGEEGEALAAPSATPGHLVVVEDEDMVLQMATLILRKLGYSVTPCSSATEALKLLETLPDPPSALLADVVMPDLNGGSLARAFQAKWPDLKVIYMSGYTAEVVSRHGILTDNGNFIQKPFTIETLSRKLRDVLADGQ